MKRGKLIFAILVFLVLSAFLHFYFEPEGDPDIFYHFRHADIYSRDGMLNSDFPWLPYTIIGKYNSDIWYGFHLLLIPFTWFENEMFGIKLAGVFVTSSLLTMFYFALRMLEIQKPLFWALFMFFISPSALYHLSLIRPHALSTGLAVLLFAAIIKERKVFAFLFSFLLVFIHISLFWIALAVLAATVLTRLYLEKKILWQETALVFLGILAGWILRPNPIGALKISFSVIFGIPIAKLQGVPLNLGSELMALSPLDLLSFLPFIAFWCAAFFLLLKNRQSFSKLPSAVLSSGALSILFFLMSLFLAQRSFDLWIPFGTIFIVFVCERFFSDLKRANKISFIVFLNTLMVFIIALASYIYANSMSGGLSGEEFKREAEWIQQNSEKGEVVFNASWDYFPHLFFWNTKNRYVGGTDPIVLFRANPVLYAETELMRRGEELEHAHAFLQEDLKAGYIVLKKSSEEVFFNYLKGSSQFTLGLETKDAAVFKIH